jgi:hypothetical protein
MSMVNKDSRFRVAASQAVVPLDCLKARVRHYLDEHPQVSWQEFLLDAIQNEIARREPGTPAIGWGDSRWGSRGTRRWAYHRHRLTAEDIRLHA